jgi:hypothetical protein
LLAMSPYKEYYFYHIAYRATCQVPDLYSKIPTQVSVVPYDEERRSGVSRRYGHETGGAAFVTALRVRVLVGVHLDVRTTGSNALPLVGDRAGDWNAVTAIRSGHECHSGNAKAVVQAVGNPTARRRIRPPGPLSARATTATWW